MAALLAPVRILAELSNVRKRHGTDITGVPNDVRFRG